MQLFLPLVEEERAVQEQVDALTKNWLVERDEHWQYVNEIKYEYCVVPLFIYQNEQFIEPINMKNTVQQALVELHFELQHFCIQKKGQDLFNGSIEQLIILQPGEDHPVSLYKQKNFQEASPICIYHKVELEEVGEVFSPNQARASMGSLAGDKGALVLEEDSQFVTVEVGNERSALFGE